MSHDEPPQGFGPHADPSRREPMAHSDSDRSIGMLANLAPLIAMVVTVNFASLIAPWLMWVIYKDSSPFIRRCAANTFNFDLSMWGVAIVGWILVFTIVGSPLGFLLLLASSLAQIVFHIIGALQANKGVVYDYPLQFVKVLD